MDGELNDWSSQDAVSYVEMVAQEEALPIEKRPLFRALPPANTYPVDCLGPLKPVALSICERTQAPMAIVAQSVLAAATLAVQGHRDVYLPGGGQRPLTEIFMTIADSGERKSSVDRLALAAVIDAEKDLRRAFEKALPSYQNSKVAWDTARESAKRLHKGNMAALTMALDATGPEPKPPAHTMLLAADPTPEALSMHLSGRPSAGIFTAEGGIFRRGRRDDR